MTATPETLHKFVAFCQQHITGDEKGQARVFLDRFFQATRRRFRSRRDLRKKS